MDHWSHRADRTTLKEFLKLLSTQGHLATYSIPKSHMKGHWFQYAGTKIPFYIMMRTLMKHKLLLRNNDQPDLLLFNSEQLQNFFDTDVRPKRKETFVAQPVAFRKPKKKSTKKDVFNESYCKLCGTGFKSKKTYSNHVKSARHIFLTDFFFARHNLKKPKHVYVSFENVKSLDSIVLQLGVQTPLVLSIKNDSLHDYSIEKFLYEPINSDIFGPLEPCDLNSKESVSFSLTAQIDEIGDIICPFIIEFRKKHDAELEKMVLPIELVFRIHSDSLDYLLPTEPYTKPKTAVFKDNTESIDGGLRPPSTSTSVIPMVELGQYKIPRDVVYLLNVGLDPKKINEDQEKTLLKIKNLLEVPEKSNCLNTLNYAQMLEFLLHVEEHQMIKDIHDYDRTDQVLHQIPRSNLLRLNVPGLSENRPSVTYGDSVYVKENEESKVKYQGYVHRIEQENVILGFSTNFLNKVYLPNKKFIVMFEFNRFPLRVEHQAVKMAKLSNIIPLLFPKKVHEPVTTTKELTWSTSGVVPNEEQKEAVRHILQKSAFPAPYLIFGPPGTGKTLTIAEAVYQIYKTSEDKVLICTPSNTAANAIGDRLLKVIPKTAILRFVAASCNINDMSPELQTRTNYRGGLFYFPEVESLTKYRIVISTLINASRLVNLEVPYDNFEYLFIDEAGHATETESLTAIAGILSSSKHKRILNGQIVLTGDPKQLGAIVHSKFAEEYGFGRSMLERLMNTELYSKVDGVYNPAMITKLVKNYRSHSAIIKVPNDLFYDEDLVACGGPEINLGLGWEGLPNPNFPLIFHSVIAKDLREGNSPSFFNLREIEQVLIYLKQLIGTNFSGITITQKHIGIITPYRKQVEKLKNACSKNKYDDILIGSVEQIQGQERLIVIVSTVRSTPSFIKDDLKFHLGFLNNPKRLNVTVTRAKALLIIVGNPNILCQDPYWKTLIEYIKENEGCKGDSFDLSEKVEDEVESIAAEISAINLNDSHEEPIHEEPMFTRDNI